VKKSSHSEQERAPRGAFGGDTFAHKSRTSETFYRYPVGFPLAIPQKLPMPCKSNIDNILLRLESGVFGITFVHRSRTSETFYRYPIGSPWQTLPNCECLVKSI